MTGRPPGGTEGAPAADRRPSDGGSDGPTSGRRGFLAALAGGLAALSGCAELEVGPGMEPRSRDSPEPSPETGNFDEKTRQRAKQVGVQVREAVVVVGHATDVPGRRSQGTGWLYDDRVVVTNSHVVGQVDSPTVETFGGETREASLLGRVRDMRPDVAALELDGAVGADPLPRGSRADLADDQPLVQVGHPGMVGRWAIALGRFHTYDERFDWLLSTVPSEQGNSGSPLVTLDGRVVGLTSGTRPKPRYGPDNAYRGDDPPVFAGRYPDADYSAHVPVGTVEEQVAGWRGG